MRKLSREKVENIRKSKGKITDEDGRLIFPYLRDKPEPCPIPAEHAKTPHHATNEVAKKEQPDTVKLLMTVASGTQRNLEQIITIQESMAKAISEISKPKPKKRYTCAVARNGDGLIETIKVEEQ